MACDQRLVFGRTRSWLSCRDCDGAGENWTGLSCLQVSVRHCLSLGPQGSDIFFSQHSCGCVVWVVLANHSGILGDIFAGVRNVRYASSKLSCVCSLSRALLSMTPSLNLCVSCILPSMHSVSIDCPSSSLRYFCAATTERRYKSLRHEHP